MYFRLLRVWNGLGEVGLTARVTDDIMAGTAPAPGIWWNKHSGDGRNVNQLTPQYGTDMGASGQLLRCAGAGGGGIKEYNI